MQTRLVRGAGGVFIGAVVLLTLGARSDAPLAGSIGGMVGVTGTATYEGAAPAGAAIDMSGDAYCARVSAGTPVLTRTVATDAQGRLAEVVVYIKEGLPRGNRSVRQDSVLLDQQGCMYTPRVLAVQTRQPLVIRNSDETLHNVHVRAKNNREFNIGQPLSGMRSLRTFTAAELGVGVSCDVHGWMSAAIAVLDHPYFAVSGENGSFSIADVPPGEYVVEAWHATLGTRQQRVTVTAGQAANITFTFAAQ